MFMTMLQLIPQVSGNDKCLTVPYDILDVNESHYGCHGYRFVILSMRWAPRQEIVQQRLYSAWGTNEGWRNSWAYNMAQPNDSMTLNAINVWFALKIKKRQKKQTLDWRVNIMACMWLNPIIPPPYIASWRLIRHSETVWNCGLLM